MTTTTILNDKNYIFLRSAAGDDAWISVPSTGGGVRGSDQAGASLTFIEKHPSSLSSGAEIKSNDFVCMRGTAGTDPNLIVDANNVGAEVNSDHAQPPSIINIRKLIPGDNMRFAAHGDLIRSDDYVILRDTAGGNLRFRLDKEGGPLYTVPTDREAAPFQIEGIQALNVQATPPTDEWVEIGWLDVPPCSRVLWRNDGPFGLPSPTLQWGRQKMTVFASYARASLAAAKSDITDCLVEAGKVATWAAIVTSPAAALPSFVAAFDAALAQKNVPARLIKIPKLKVESQCDYS